MAKILTVDDSTLIRSVVKNFVSKAGHEAVMASNGKEGVEVFKNENPDIVFMDIKMPEMDGFEALAEIKKINPDAKVVMCTSLKEESDEKKAKELGAVGYIMKPFSSEDIINSINNNL